MKKISLSLMAAAFMAMAMFACKSGAANDPKATAMAFMEALKNKDWDGAEKLGTKDTKSFLETMRSMMKMAEGMPGAKTEDMDFAKEWKGKTVTYSDPKIDGDNANVSMVVDGKEQMPISLKKEDGAWKVAFDKTTLMKQATDKMGENHQNSNVDSAMNSIKDLNGMKDSINKAMGEVNKILDSAKKSVDQK